MKCFCRTGKRDLHITECCEDSLREDKTQTVAPGGGQRPGRLRRYMSENRRYQTKLQNSS